MQVASGCAWRRQRTAVAARKGSFRDRHFGGVFTQARRSRHPTCVAPRHASQIAVCAPLGFVHVPACLRCVCMVKKGKGPHSTSRPVSVRRRYAARRCAKSLKTIGACCSFRLNFLRGAAAPRPQKSLDAGRRYTLPLDLAPVSAPVRGQIAAHNNPLVDKEMFLLQPQWGAAPLRLAPSFSFVTRCGLRLCQNLNFGILGGLVPCGVTLPAPEPGCRSERKGWVWWTPR